MKRLQDDLGVQLFRKRGRGLALTEAGETALVYARRILGLHDELVDAMQGANLAGLIRIGCPQDFAPMLPAVLSRFAILYPRMQIELLIEGNAALVEKIEKSRIDLAVVVGHDDRPSSQAIGRLDVVWIASSTFEPPQGQPLPLAVLGPQCTFRRTAIQQLEAAHVPFRIAATSPSVDGLWAALVGGLGVTARAALNLREGLVCGESLYNLPALGSVPVTLHRTASSHGVATDRMASLLVDSLGMARNT
jgi:DNA-binding transcriptional LysR family regulator